MNKKLEKFVTSAQRSLKLQQSLFPYQILTGNSSFITKSKPIIMEYYVSNILG